MADVKLLLRCKGGHDCSIMWAHYGAKHNGTQELLDVLKNLRWTWLACGCVSVHFSCLINSLLQRLVLLDAIPLNYNVSIVLACGFVRQYPGGTPNVVQVLVKMHLSK